MLDYLVRLSRDPIKSRRSAAKRLVVSVAILILGPPLVGLWMAPRAGLKLDLEMSGVLIVALFLLLSAVCIPVLALYARPRRQRERYLTSILNAGEVVQSVFLTPNLIQFIERETKKALNPYGESVTLGDVPWSGGVSRTPCGSVGLV